MSDARSALRAEMSRRRWKALATILLCPLGFVLIMSTLGNRVHPYGLVALLAALGLLVSYVHGQVWRCPKCEGQLGRNATPEACHRCGEPLR